MRLLNVSLKTYLFYSVLIVLIGTPICFFIIREILEEEIDESLKTHSNAFATHIKKFEYLEDLEIDMEVIDALVYNIDIKPAKQQNSNESYRAVSVYDSIDHEQKPYRELTSLMNVNNKPYQLTIRMSLVENDELVLVIGFVLAALIVFLSIGLFFINRSLSKKILSPFYNTLQKLKAYKLDNNKPFEFEKTNVIEFNDLNSAIKSLTEKNNQVFRQQKSFIENASHELQTPLAIFQSKLDMLMQNPDLTEDQAILIKDLISNNQRIAKLNKSLLIISRIENDQYLEKEEIDLASVLQETLANYHLLAEGTQISDEKLIQSCPLTNNRYLLEILVNNLIRNAYEHNVNKGKIVVELNSDALIVSNTGNSLEMDSNQLFERFKKGKINSSGSGLGLSIVKKICDFSGYDIKYELINGMHQFKILFN